MSNLSRSELLLYGGIAIMVITVIIAILYTIVFLLKWKKLQRMLEQEYGKLQ